MAHYESLSAALDAIHRLGASRHRTARVLLFIHRHPDAHRKIIGQLRRRQQRRQRRMAKRRRPR